MENNNQNKEMEIREMSAEEMEQAEQASKYINEQAEQAAKGMARLAADLFGEEQAECRQ